LWRHRHTLTCRWGGQAVDQRTDEAIFLDRLREHAHKSPFGRIANFRAIRLLLPVAVRRRTCFGCHGKRRRLETSMQSCRRRLRHLHCRVGKGPLGGARTWRSADLADYGSSQGKNSLAPMRTAIEILRSRVGTDRPILVCQIDLAISDFRRARLDRRSEDRLPLLRFPHSMG